MLDINLLRTNPDLVRENIRKKFQDAKLPLVDEVIELDARSRSAKAEAFKVAERRVIEEPAASDHRPVKVTVRY